jgi:hypothetical protein
VVAPCWLFGTDDYLEVPDNDLLDFAATDSFTVIAAVRTWATQGVEMYVAKKADLTSAVGWAVYGVSGLSYIKISDGTNIPNTGLTGAYGAVSMVTATRSVAADTVAVTLNGGGFNTLADSTTGTLANAEVMRVGRLSGAGTSYGAFEGYFFAVFRRALTAAEITLVSDYFKGRAA